jgi:hypothetical protein
MQKGLYVHPFDVDDLHDRGGLAALRDLGFDEAAMAVAYHAGRWLAPGMRTGLVRYLEDGTVHFRPSGGYGALQPRASRLVPERGDDPLQRFLAAAAASGLGARAWIVLFHNSRLGSAHRESCVRNAFGEAYEHALCPARPEVRAYGLQVVRDVAAHAGLAGIEVEAAGFFGHRHNGHHDKSSFPTAAHTDFLLSCCFCAHCCAGMARHAVDAEVLRERVRVALRALITGGDALAPGRVADVRSWLCETIGEAALAAVLAHRSEVCRGFLAEVRAALPRGVHLAAHVELDPLFTGSQMGLPAGVVRGVLDEVVLTRYGEDAAAIERDLAQHPRDVPTRLCFWPRAPQFRGEDDVRRAAVAARTHGCVGVRIYHLGLLPWRTLERVAAAL